MRLYFKKDLSPPLFYHPFGILYCTSDSGSGLGFCGFIWREIVASSPILGRSTPLDTSLLLNTPHSATRDTVGTNHFWSRNQNSEGHFFWSKKMVVSILWGTISGKYLFDVQKLPKSVECMPISLFCSIWFKFLSLQVFTWSSRSQVYRFPFFLTMARESEHHKVWL